MIMPRLITIVAWITALLGVGFGVQRLAHGRSSSPKVEFATVAPRPVTALPGIAKAKHRQPAPHASGTRQSGLPAQPSPLQVSLVSTASDVEPSAPSTRGEPPALGALVEATAGPGSLHIVTVPVPAELPTGGTVQYAIVPEPGTRILPPLVGELPPSGASERRPVVVTAEVSAHAAAGARPLAWVEFSEGGILRQRVPIRLAVAQVHRVALRLAQSVLGARAGDRVPFRYFLTNTGNAPDTIDLRVITPSGWRVEGLPARHVLAAGASVTGDLLILIPQSSGDGSLRIRFLAASGGVDLATADATVEVVRGGVLSGRGNGPNLTTGIASVLTDQATASPVLGAELQGPLANGMRVAGRLILPTDRVTADALALARVGYYLGGSYLALATDTWTATAGSSGRSFSDITGLNIYGRGGAFSYDDPHLTVDALAAAPASGDQTGSGHLYGARVGAKISGGWLGATATDLLDEQFQVRELQAFGLGGVTPPYSGATLSGEVAERHFAGGSGLGWSTELDHRSERDYLQVRAMSAPGGSAAFARASQELSATASHGFGRVLVGGGLWQTDDENPAYSKLRSTGWSLSPQIMLTSHITLLTEARASAYTAASTVGDFGNSERTLRLGATVRYGAVYGIGSVFVGDASRNTALPAAPSVTTTSSRDGAIATAGWITTRGTVEGNLAYERNGPGVGYLPQQATATLRAQGVSVLSDGGGPLFNAEVQYYSWFGTVPAVTVLRAGMQAPLPGELLLTVDVEHNPLLTGRDAVWVPVVKLEHTLHLPGVARARARGVVYEDRNGNGVRDPGEPGISGVVVRRDGEAAVTDHNGAFVFRGTETAPVRIDETSLPFGLVANPASGGQTGEGPFTIGVWPTAAVTVRLVPTPDSTGRLPHARLQAAGVRAVDQLGNSWSAVVDSAGVARFDALPPGTYRLELDVSNVREPVRVRGALPTFQVVPGRPVPILTVPLLPRPIRLFDPTKQTGRDPAHPEGHR